MNRKGVIFSSLLLILVVPMAFLMVQGSKVQAREYIVGRHGQSQGGGFTLESSIRPLSLDAGETELQASDQLSLQGGGYTLHPNAQNFIAERLEEASTSVISRTHSVNPGAFLYDQDSTDIVMSIYYGLRWVANSTERGGFYMNRPPDWDDQTPVKVRITFALGNNNAGTVNWRLRLNTYTPNNGEWLTNPAARDADEILVFASGPSSLRIYDQTFTIQPADFNNEPYWSFFFTRGDGTNGETFTGNLYVMGVEVFYETVQ